MAPVHNQIHRQDWNDALKRALGLTKSEGGLERFGETLSPIVNLWGLPEWAYLRREALFAGGSSEAAVAAEVSGVALTNPAGSGLIVIVDRITAGGAAQSARITPTSLRTTIEASYALRLVCQVRDQRWYKDPITPGFQTRVEIWGGTTAGGLGGVQTEKINLIATTYTEAVSPPYIIKPNFSLLVEGNSNLTAIDVNFVGRVRQALPGELV